MEAFLGLVALAVALYVVAGIRSVGPQQSAVIERLGKYHRTAEPGMTWVVPFVDRVRRRVDMREQVRELKDVPVITGDNEMVLVSSATFLRVEDAAKSVYEVFDYGQAVDQLTITTLRNLIGSMTLEQVRTSKGTLDAQLTQALNDARQWGVRIVLVEIKSIVPRGPAGTSGAHW